MEESGENLGAFTVIYCVRKHQRTLVSTVSLLENCIVPIVRASRLEFGVRLD